MKRRLTALQILCAQVKAQRRTMPPPTTAFQDRRRVQKAHRLKYGDDSCR